jgi:hypothetical protein
LLAARHILFNGNFMVIHQSNDVPDTCCLPASLSFEHFFLFDNPPHTLTCPYYINQRNLCLCYLSTTKKTKTKTTRRKT